jgi:hypothetical protein
MFNRKYFFLFLINFIFFQNSYFMEEEITQASKDNNNNYSNKLNVSKPINQPILQKNYIDNEEGNMLEEEAQFITKIIHKYNIQVYQENEIFSGIKNFQGNISEEINPPNTPETNDLSSGKQFIFPEESMKNLHHENVEQKQENFKIKLQLVQQEENIFSQKIDQISQQMDQIQLQQQPVTILLFGEEAIKLYTKRNNKTITLNEAISLFCFSYSVYKSAENLKYEFNIFFNQCQHLISEMYNELLVQKFFIDNKSFINNIINLLEQYNKRDFSFKEKEDIKENLNSATLKFFYLINEI